MNNSLSRFKICTLKMTEHYRKSLKNIDTKNMQRN